MKSTDVDGRVLLRARSGVGNLSGMPLRDILIFPHKALREKAKPVEKIDASVRQLLDDMAETMYHAPGIGLAAPQIGVSKRVIVVDVTAMLKPEEPGPGLLKLVNPKIVEKTGVSHFEEGCLSLPGLLEEIERAAAIQLEFLDAEGKKAQLSAEGILATALQHEIDHLDGILILDYLSPLKRTRYKSQLKKALKEAAKEAAHREVKDG
jgi:peptide deformylase